MSPADVLLLSASDVLEILTIEDCIAAVENAFRLYGEGKAAAPGVLSMHVPDGAFHIKAGALALSRPYFASKVNGNFPDNPARSGLPTIQGVIVLCDAGNGRLLAIMDSIEITALRTAAATAVAAKHLARRDAAVVTIYGCGRQGRAQLRALARVRPLKQVFAYDKNAATSKEFARDLGEELQIPVTHVADPWEALRRSAICVTCTTSREAVLHPGDVSPGTFIAAVGADNPQKQELQPGLMAAGKVVVDVLGQCAALGDLHHAIAAGAMKLSDVHAELAEVVAGVKPGRTSDEEIIIFDSTGMALQDVAAAAVAFEKAASQGRGTRLAFNPCAA
ncbi:MAG TPA: ornithine cyclodeaminase family protein [Terriglobales bacterium]|jgi:alanine dehydrogenase